MQEEHLNGFYDNKGEPLKCPYSEGTTPQFIKWLLMATRRRRSTAKVTTTAATSPSIVQETKVVSVKKSSIKAPKSVNKVTQPKVNKVTEVTATPTNNGLDLQKLVKDYPRDAFAIALLPLLLLEALTKEGLKIAGVSL